MVCSLVFTAPLNDVFAEFELGSLDFGVACDLFYVWFVAGLVLVVWFLL